MDGLPESLQHRGMERDVSEDHLDSALSFASMLVEEGADSQAALIAAADRFGVPSSDLAILKEHRERPESI